MNKLYAKAVAFTLVLYTPMLAWGVDPVGWATKKAEGLVMSVLIRCAKCLVGYIRGMLIPHQDYWVLSILLSILTLVWLLGIPHIRRFAGRLWGIFWALFLFLAVTRTITTMWNEANMLVKIVLFVVGFFLIGILAGFAWSFLKFLFRMGWGGLTTNDPNPAKCFVGALMVSMLINGKYFSKPTNYYWPSIVSATAGLVVGIVLIVLAVRKWQKKKKDEAKKVVLEICPDCGNETLGRISCSKCGYKRPESERREQSTARRTERERSQTTSRSAQKPGLITCPNCGQQAMGMIKCTNCHIRRDESAPAPQRPPHAPPAQPQVPPQAVPPVYPPQYPPTGPPPSYPPQPQAPPYQPPASVAASPQVPPQPQTGKKKYYGSI